MKRYKILAMGVILAFLFGNTAVMAGPVIKKQTSGAASPVKVADAITGITVTPANPGINKAIEVTVHGTITPGKQCSILFLKGDGTPQSKVGHATSFPFKFGGEAYPLFVYSKAGTYTIKVYCGDGKCTGVAQAVVRVGVKMQSSGGGAVPIKQQTGSAASPAKAAASSLVQAASKIEVKSLTAPVGKDSTLEARLITGKGELLGGKMIEFKVNNKPIGSFPTAASGTASAGTAKAPFHVSGDYPPGAYKIEARFSGDATARMGHGQGTLTVVKAKTKFEMTLIKSMNPPLIGGLAHLAGYLINTANPASEIKDRKVTVRVSRSNFTETHITTKKGEFYFHPPVPLDLAALNSLDPKLPFTVEAEFGGDTYFEPTRAQFTFTAGGQPAPQIKAVERVNDNYLKLKGEYFIPAQYENDWNHWITEFKNWVFIYADDGTGRKPVPLISGRAGDINMREIGLNVTSFNLQAIKFKVVRGKQESNLFSYSYVRGKDINLVIESIDPARTKVGDPDENAFTLKLHITSFSYLLNPGTKIMFSGERIPFKDAKFKTQSPEDKANNEGWFEFHVPVNYRHLPGPYKIQVISDKGVESNIVYWNLYRPITVNPAKKTTTTKIQ